MIIVLCQNPEPEFRGDKQENYLKITNYITFFSRVNLPYTVLENYSKCRILIFSNFGNFGIFGIFFLFKNDLSGNTV